MFSLFNRKKDPATQRLNFRFSNQVVTTLWVVTNTLVLLEQAMMTFLPTFFHIAHCHPLPFTVLSLSDRASICVFQLNRYPEPYVLRYI